MPDFLTITEIGYYQNTIDLPFLHLYVVAYKVID